MHPPNPGVIHAVTPLPVAPARNALIRVALTVLLTLLGGIATEHGAEPSSEPPTANDSDAFPEPFGGDAFEALLTSSPFTRSLGVSDSLILTGVARFGEEIYATLLDTKTMDSQVVSQTPNGAGWQLISVGGDPAKLQTWTATIQIRGGETISIRYQKPPPRPPRSSSSSRGTSSGSGGNPPLSNSQLEEAKKAAVNYREGFSSDGYPRQPPPEMVEKLSRLSVDQRADINRQMIGIRNRGLGMDDRRRIYEDMVNRASQSRR